MTPGATGGPRRRPNVGTRFYRDLMDLAHAPEAPMETLFPELPPDGARPVEVAVTVPDGDSRRCVMHVVAAEDDAAQAIAMAVGACRGVDGFELTARRFAG